MTVPIDLRLLPSTAALSEGGRLSVGGCDLGELAEVYVYPDDKQIHEIHCKLLDAGKESYAVQLWQLPE